MKKITDLGLGVTVIEKKKQKVKKSYWLSVMGNNDSKTTTNNTL